MLDIGLFLAYYFAVSSEEEEGCAEEFSPSFETLVLMLQEQGVCEEEILEVLKDPDLSYDQKLAVLAEFLE